MLALPRRTKCTRSVAPQPAESLGRSIVVDNRVGAGGTIGLELVARSAPDDYTLLHASDAAILVSPQLYIMLRALRYHPCLE